MSRDLISILLAGMLVVLECACGGGGTVPPPPAMSITTATLPDWMATFAYTQTVQATGGSRLLPTPAHQLISYGWFFDKVF